MINDAKKYRDRQEMMQVTTIQLSGHQRGKHLYSNFLISSFYKWNLLLSEGGKTFNQDEEGETKQ